MLIAAGPHYNESSTSSKCRSRSTAGARDNFMIRSGAPQVKRRGFAAQTLMWFWTIALLAAAGSTMVEFGASGSDYSELDLSPEADETVHQGWLAVPFDVPPTTGTNGRRELGSEETTPKPGAWNKTGSHDQGGSLEGGEFGLLADWLEAVSLPTEGGLGATTLRGELCKTDHKLQETHKILQKRKATPSDSKVAVCVRTKDSGRFLPEWVAYHYAIGVDEMTVYDDDSEDDTRQILQPFVDAGVVVYLFDKVEKRAHMMDPLNHCLRNHIQRRETDSTAPAWIIFHDVDEYIFPTDTSASISEALMRHATTCCIEVPRVQYGTGGYSQMPRGLLLENFLTHASPDSFKDNRLPKVLVNLDPSDPSLGVITPKLKGMHTAQGCECEEINVSEIRINHYLGSSEDYLEKTRRFWKERYNRMKVEKILKERDVNLESSDTIGSWACATREVLYRIVEGMDLEWGLE